MVGSTWTCVGMGKTADVLTGHVEMGVRGWKTSRQHGQESSKVIQLLQE